MMVPEIREWIALGVALFCGGLTTYITLRLTPIVNEQKHQREDHEALAEKLDKQLYDAITDFHNFDRWRGGVTAMLEQNANDHDEIKATLMRVFQERSR
jgi:hypothetical protein